MTAAEIERVLWDAVDGFVEGQRTLFAMTPDSRTTEWNIANHLATELRSRFVDHHCDVELLKPQAGNRRPDIVIHQRGTHAQNLLVVEVKRDVAEIDSELQKVRDHWFAPPFRYKFGAVIVVPDEGSPTIALSINAS